jgi:DNA-binding NarL/FixJ family response regulator
MRRLMRSLQTEEVTAVSAEPQHVPELSVAIIKDHGVLPAGIDGWLAGVGRRVKVVAIYTDPDEFLTDHPGVTSAVDVVVWALTVDGSKPDVVALERLCRTGHRVVVYGGLLTDQVITNIVDAGAISYVAQRQGRDDYVVATLHTGALTLSAALRMATTISNAMSVARPGLTRREIEVLIAWCHAATKHDVAERLSIERATVSTHLQRIRAKYAIVGRPARTKAALIARAIQDGFVGLDEL